MIIRLIFSLKMDIDPDFEFECPKWYDFTQEEDGEHEECLDDSWFEREHPLHEPKDKEQSLKELKPLIELNEKQTDNEKIKTEEKIKYKNPEKSLGVKRSVRLMRGEQGPTGRRKLPETTGLKRRNSSEGIKYSKGQRSGGRDEKSSREDFGDNRNFTPPWGLNSPASRPETSEDADVSPKTALLCSPLRGPLISPPVNSPKNTLLAKAVNKAARTSQKSKRRMLPAIPCSNQITAHLPLRGNLQSEAITPPCSVEESKTIKEPNKNLMKDATNDKQFLNPIRQNIDSSNIMTREQNDQDMDGISNENARNDNPVSVEDLLKLHNQKVLASKNKYDSNGRRIQRRSVTAVYPEGVNSKINTNCDQKNLEEDLKEEEISVGTTTMNNIGSINEEANSRRKESTKSVDSNSESHVMTTEALLKLHNQRVMASKCKYDSNGRRIRTATPSFCAAPTKSDVTEKTSVAQSKGRRSVSTTTALAKKRPSSITDCETKGKTKQKQQRRSCVAAPKTQETICATENIKQDRIGNGKTSSTKTAALQSISKSSSSNLKRNAVTQDAKCQQKNKRRSCNVAPVSSLSSCSSKGTGLAAQNRQKRRSCVAAPQTPKRVGSDSVDQELKDLIARHNQRLAKNK